MMVQAIVNISEDSNRVLNVVKAKYGLNDKSQAIDRVVMEYAEQVLEPEYRPEFVKRIREIEKEPRRKIDLDEFFKK